MKGSLLFVVFAVCIQLCLLSSCGLLKTSASAVALKAQKMKEDRDKKYDLNKDNSGSGTLSGLGRSSPKVTLGKLPDENDITWAPEDPNEPIAHLDELWSKPVRDSWYISYEEAIEASRQSGKPILMWFTNSRKGGSGAIGRRLDAELFSRSGFDKWAKENVVRLRIDSFIQDDNEDRYVKKKNYVSNLKKRYKVLGNPVVVMLSPRGSVFGKYVGYKPGNSNFYFGKLKHAHGLASVDYGKWRGDLEAKGYRFWHDSRGRSVFAKLLRYNKGRLLLVQPDGKKAQTTESKLSKEDRTWIANELEKRRAT